MLNESRDLWLDNVKNVATDTLSRINRKAKSLGHFDDVDDATTNLCMGYLYLLSLCEQHELFVQDEPSWYLIRDIDKKEKIH